MLFQRWKLLCLLSSLALRVCELIFVCVFSSGLWGWDCKFSAIAKENCALRCVSAACYGKIYGEDPVC